MSLGRDLDPWVANPGDAIDAALKAIETALQELLSADPAYWRTGQKKDILERVEKLQAQQAALKLRVLASAGDIAEETGAKDASGWLRTELLVDKAEARSQIKLAAGVAKYDLVAAGLASMVSNALVITRALSWDTTPSASPSVTRLCLATPAASLIWERATALSTNSSVRSHPEASFAPVSSAISPAAARTRIFSAACLAWIFSSWARRFFFWLVRQ